MDVGGLPCRGLAPRLHRRGRLRDLGRRPATPRGLARTPARPSRRCAPAGLGARDSLRLEAGLPPLRPRHRRHHQPGRGRARLVDRASAGASEGGFAGAAVDPAPARRGPAAQAGRPEARGQGAGPRGHRDPGRPTAGRSARSPAAASAPPSAGRSPWAMSRPPRAAPGTELVAPGPRQAAAGARRRPALRPPPLPSLTGEPCHGRPSYTKDHEWVRDRGRHRHGRHQPSTPRSSWATWCSSSCPRSARSVAKGEQAAVVESVKAASEIYAPDRRRGRRGQRRRWSRTRPWSTAAPRASGWFFKLRVADADDARGPDGPRRLRRLPRDARLTMPSAATRIEAETRDAVRRPPHRPRARPSSRPCWRSSAPPRSTS